MAEVWEKTSPPQVPPDSSSIDTGLSCLLIVARFHGVPADGAQLRHQFAKSGARFGETELLQAAKLAGAHDFILELPQGYDTVIGEHGSTLSGGQRQRIAIARALITNPRLLIFDEATSALDYESEAVIQQNLVQICKGRTVFMIAHRLNMVQNADLILVIEKGDITEQGTHEELLRLNGYYARLYRQQRGLYAIA